jgi:VCBS repeat-containing protein
MSATTLRRILALCLSICVSAVCARQASAQCSGTILTNTSQFTFSTNLINFETFPGGGAVLYGSADLADQWKVSPFGVRITDSSGGNGASAYGSTFSQGPHSGTHALSHSENAANGFVQFQFVVPNTNTPTSYQEVGIWVENGDGGQDAVTFYDCNNTLICTQLGPLPPGLGGPGDAFVGVRYAPGISMVRITGNGFFMCDDLQYGGNVACGGGGNLPPDITEVSPLSLNVQKNSTCPGAANQLTINATDPNDAGANLTWSVLTLPAHGTVTFPNGTTGGSTTVCYAPTAGQCGSDTFIVQVMDPGALTDTITVNVTVANANPVITQGVSVSKTVVQNTTCPYIPNQINLSATDTNDPGANLNWSILTAPLHGSVSFVGGTSGGSINVCYAPNAAQSAADSFVVRVTDQCGATDTILVNITVLVCNPANKANVNLDGVIDGKDISTFISILLNPSIATPEQLCRADIGSLGLACNSDAVVDFNDIQGFVYLILYGTCNAPPIIGQGDGPLGLAAQVNSTCPNAANNVSLTATDPDGPAGSLSWSILSAPSHGAVSFSGGITTGGAVTICYAPTGLQCSADSYTVLVQDGATGQDTITVNISINNAPPDITQGASTSMSVVHNSTNCAAPANQIVLNATDSDGSAAQLLWSIASQPPAGQGTASIVGSATGASVTICYTPGTDQCGASSFSVRVQDSCLASDTITVNTSITNQLPIITQGDTLPLTVQFNSICSANQFGLSASHPDGALTLLNWSISTAPPANHGTASFVGGTNGGSVTVCYTPTTGQTEATSFVVRVTDNCGGQDTITINVTVGSNNQDPVITEGLAVNLSVPKNSICPDPLNEITLHATDDGPVGQLTWSISTPPSPHGFASIDGSNQGASAVFCYEPEADQAAADSFVVRVQDAQGAFDTITVNVSVQNEPPVIDQGDGPLSLNVQQNSNCPGLSNQVDLGANDPDGPDGSMIWSVLDPANTGTVSFVNNISTGQSISVCYKPNTGQSAADDFTIKVTDTCGGIDLVTVQVTVTP